MQLFSGTKPSGVVLTRFTMEVATALATGIFGAVVSFGSWENGIGWDDAGPQAGYFPFYIGLLVVLASVGSLVQAFRHHRTGGEVFLNREQTGRVLAFGLPMAGFVVLTVLLGLYVATAIYLFGVMVVQGRYRLWQAAAVSLGTSVFFFVLFEIWFQVPILKGPIEAWLGIY